MQEKNLTHFWDKITHAPKTRSPLCGLHLLGSSSQLLKDFVQWGLFPKTHTFSLVKKIIMKITLKFIMA